MKTIEFASVSETNTNNIPTSPWTLPPHEKKKSYEDLILKAEYADRVLQFPIGMTWMRIMPALASSVCGWMLPLHALHYEGGRFTHPRTLKKSAKSVFDHAYAWAKQNAPDSLFSRANRAGIRLLTNPICLYWVLVEQEGQFSARLLLASGYDGSRGGIPGLGWRIWQLCQERDETGNLMADAVSAEGGVLIQVEKSQLQGAKYPNYQLRLGREPRPMTDLLKQMALEERAVLCPLENVVRELSEEEQYACLAKVISPENVKLIRESLDR